MPHGFGSYHFAKHNNGALMAAEMGHTGEKRTLFAHYPALVRGAVLEDQAGPKGANIVAFEQVAA